ncbi:hypothetical protein [Streptomyces sp. XY332]|nr:hypothetical protein [Streptomyces sp. XY332]
MVSPLWARKGHGSCGLWLIAVDALFGGVGDVCEVVAGEVGEFTFLE